jgi:hypothetical protein
MTDARTCEKCGAALAESNSGRLCYACITRVPKPDVTPRRPPPEPEPPPELELGADAEYRVPHRPQPQAPELPVVEAPLEGRLGIIHLLVWITCVGCVFGLRRLLFPPTADEAFTPEEAYGAFSKVWLGTALCGLVLAAARWVRGRRFPVQPGEWIWLAMGFRAAASLVDDIAWTILWHTLYHEGKTLDVPLSLGLFHRGAEFAVATVVTAAFIVAAIGVRQRRWRWWMVLGAVATGVFPLVMLLRETTWHSLWVAIVLLVGGKILPALLLVALVLMDMERRHRCPWSHFAGVALFLVESGAILLRAAVSLLKG